MIVATYHVTCDGDVLDGFQQGECELLVKVGDGKWSQNESSALAEADAKQAGWTKVGDRHYCPGCARLWGKDGGR